MLAWGANPRCHTPHTHSPVGAADSVCRPYGVVPIWGNAYPAFASQANDPTHLHRSLRRVVVGIRLIVAGVRSAPGSVPLLLMDDEAV